MTRRTAPTPTEALFSRVTKTETCWVFTGSDKGNGYGCLCVNRRTVSAHRLAYELQVGPIPEGLTIDHLCRNKRCVRPDHLEVVTLEENGRRGSQYTGATHCIRGHEFTPENTLLFPPTTKRAARRRCFACYRSQQANYRARRREERAA